MFTESSSFFSHESSEFIRSQRHPTGIGIGHTGHSGPLAALRFYRSCRWIDGGIRPCLSPALRSITACGRDSLCCLPSLLWCVCRTRGGIDHFHHQQWPLASVVVTLPPPGPGSYTGCDRLGWGVLGLLDEYAQLSIDNRWMVRFLDRYAAWIGRSRREIRERLTSRRPTTWIDLYVVLR